MKTLSIKTRIFIPIGIIIAVIVFVVAWVVVGQQTEGLERGFGDSLETLASLSPNMIHSVAGEYTEKRGLHYYRVTDGATFEASPEGKMQREAFEAFRANPNLDKYEQRMEKDGVAHLYVYAPGRLREECATCHDAIGIDTFKSRKDGDLVAMFGVSGSTEELIAQQTSLQRVVLAVGLLTVAVVLSIVNKVADRVIVRPLQEFVLQAERVADGDLTRVDTPEISKKMESQDEIGQMARAFRKMITGLRTLISQVGEATSAVAGSSNEISASTEEMAAGAHEQTSQAAEVASAVEEMAKTIIENSRNAQATAETSKKAKDAAIKGGEVVDETVERMKRIADVVRKSSETVQTLGTSSDTIGEIVGVIQDIADQTNLLALNAAIEAARAGELGRGFAVVADEVRKLAERTTKATKEIAAMIKSIQSETQGAVNAMAEGTSEVENGIQAADKAGDALKEIVRISQDLTSMVGQIASASEEQSGASEQISKNVEAISAVTGETASGTQQIARAAEDLNRLTDDLQRLVSTFKLPQAEGSDEGSRGRTRIHVREAPESGISTLAVRQNGKLVHKG